MEKTKTKKEQKEKTPKPKYNMLQNSGWMVRLAWTNGEKKVVVLLVIASMLAVLSNLVNLYITPTIISAVENNSGIYVLIGAILAFVGANMLISAISSYVNSNTMYGQVTVRCACILNAVNKKACTTSYTNLDDPKFDELMRKSYEECNGNNRSTEAVWGTLGGLLTNIAGFIIYVALLTAVQPILLVIIVATSIAGYFINNYIYGYHYRHRKEEAKLSREMWYEKGLAEDYQLAKDIRIFGLRPWISELINKSVAAYEAFDKKAEGVYFWARMADLVLSFLRNGVAYVYLIGMVLNNGLSVSEFLLYFSVVGGFTGWVGGILGGFNTLHRQSLELSTVREFLEFPEPFNFESGESLEFTPNGDYELKLENVSYRYPGAEEDTLKDINLTLRPGEKLAVVGLNGAGKTTLVKLMCGLYDPTKGRVLLNGEDIRKYNRRDYYKMFSAVFQNFSLLAGSVATNVAQSEDDIDIERVKISIAKAGLTEKIESLPDGYDSNLNRRVYEDATELSGGETQRLMLARALYKNAPFIVLDEPTAALDPIAESQMYNKYHEMTKGKSSVYISHRLASTRFCDRIAFIADAGIAEMGTHDQLMKKGGKYAELFNIQSQYYREEDNENVG